MITFEKYQKSKNESYNLYSFCLIPEQQNFKNLTVLTNSTGDQLNLLNTFPGLLREF